MQLENSFTAADQRRRLLLSASAISLIGASRAWAQASPPRPERSEVTLAVGGRTAIYYLPLTIADQLGYFKDEGLQVELQDHTAGSLALQSMLRGTANVTGGSYEHVIDLRGRGFNCLAFVFTGRAPQLVFGVSTRTLAQFKEPAQLKGRRVGITATDSATHWFAKFLLGRAGLQPGDVEYVNVGNSTSAAMAIREGRIDAIANIDPVISLLESRGEIRVLWDTRSMRGTHDLYGGPMGAGCLYTSQDFLVRYPNTVQALTNAVVRALKWLQTAGPSDIVRAVPEAFMYGDRALYLAALGKAREAMSPDGLVSEDCVETTHRVVAKYGITASAVRPPSPAATFTNDFARRAKRRFQA
ncbi:ABC transporter substrate-binding protein [Ottowia thiooxydans]|uniref:ABC transporter substrate-binding protein n=1 Tax=Ottowia thiooxydans TaxID=219182 RepID=UPI000684AFC8|nr:ABC transporter substrate-binding protein [Ottowia thiooxydans]